MLSLLDSLLKWEPGINESKIQDPRYKIQTTKSEQIKKIQIGTKKKIKAKNKNFDSRVSMLFIGFFVPLFFFFIWILHLVSCIFFSSNSYEKSNYNS